MSWISDDMLPVIFLGLMGIAMLLYAILDGYDLGIGILMVGESETNRDRMIASIGPFWDANETWLVLGVGVLLVAFPVAHGDILTALYLPVSVMLAGLILRGVSFDFRAKVGAKHKNLWDRLFSVGSLMATLSQGYMLGKYIVGFKAGFYPEVFSWVSALCVSFAYTLIGACWLVLKTTDDLQLRAIKWARIGLIVTAVGLLLVSITNPLASEAIYNRWLALPQMLYLAPLPLGTLALIWFMHRHLKKMPYDQDRYCWVPFVLCIGIYVLAFAGLAYSFYPYIIPQQLTVWEAAAAPESLRVVLLGCVVVLPAIFLYTALSYWIFRGKSTALSYV